MSLAEFCSSDSGLSEAGNVFLLMGFVIEILKYCKTNGSVEQRIFTYIAQQNSAQGNMECRLSASITWA